MKAPILPLLALLLAAPAYSQSVESDLPPEAEAAAQALEADAYVLPDFADKTLAAAKVVDDKDRFSVKLGFAFLPAD